MTLAKRDVEVQKTTLGDGWVELRIVYYRPVEGGPDYHVHGREATSAMAHFVCNFAAGIAAGHGFPELATALQKLWRVVHHRMAHCTCNNKQHHH